MKKTVVFCLFCVIFTLISASVCFAQDWEDTDFDDFDSEDPGLYYDDNRAGPAAGPGPAATPASEDSAAAAAAAAAAAEASAAAAANSAETAAAAAAAVADSVSAKVPPAPPSAPPQAPVRIVIPMMTSPAYPPPAPPQPPPPVVVPPPPPPAPPVYQQPPINVIPAMPNPYSNGLYRVQVGAFSSAGLAQQCFSRLLSAGFFPFYEPYGNVYRVVLTGIRAADMTSVVQRLATVGFYEVWIREEK
jgi:hypothetical protein